MPAIHWRFRLRTLLVLIALLTIPLAFVQFEFQKVKALRIAAAAILDMGGSIALDNPPVVYRYPSQCALPPDSSVPLMMPRDLMCLSMNIVDLSGTRATNDDLAHLPVFVSLEHLFLNDTRVTDAGLIHLRQFTELKELSIEHSQITDNGLVYLRSLRGLRELHLAGTLVTKAGIEDLQERLPSLKIDQ
jgi:hypothetical protein